MPHAPEPIDIEPDALQDRFSRFAAISIVVATLAGAFVGYLEAQASREGALANVRAQRAMVEAMSGLVRTDRAAQVDYGIFALASLHDRGATSAFQQGLFATDPIEEVRLELEQERERALARAAHELTTLSLDGPESPTADPVFPGRFFADAQHQADRLWALANAANEEDASWEAAEANLTAALTMFAVAVYLLGLSLTLRERIRGLLAGLGVTLVVVGTVWATWLATHPPEAAPDAAARAFADGRRVFLLAAEPSDFAEATRHFDRAIELRPTFAQAYADRASASFLAGSPQFAMFTSITTPEALDASIADLERAHELGLETRSVLGELGFNTFLRGLRRDHDPDLEASAGFTRLGLRGDASDPVLHYNLGAALLALGDDAGARQAYLDAIRHTLFVGPDAGEARGNPFLEGLWVSGALTDLELVAASRPGRAEAVATTKELIVGSVSLGEVDARGEAEPAEVAADLFPTEVQWQSALPGYDPAADVVASYWYQETPGGWAALPEVSGVATPGGEEGAWFSLSPFLPQTFPPRCLPDDRYRVEVYVNGELAGTAEAEAGFATPEATVLGDLNVALCHPRGWQPSERNLAGFLGGAVEEGGGAGAYVLRFQRPSIQGEDPRVTAEIFLDTAIETFADLFPSVPTFDSSAGEDFFLGLEGPVKKWFSIDGGWVLAGAGLADDGAVIIGAVYGPADRFEDGGDLLRVFDSLLEYRPL